MRCIKAELPYSITPSKMIKRMVLHAVLFKTACIDKQGISDKFTPRELIVRWWLDWKHHFRYQFGAYGQAYDEPDPMVTNTQQSRSINFICN